MSEKSYNWYKIAESAGELNFGDNNLALAEANGKKICIGKFNESLFAFAYQMSTCRRDHGRWIYRRFRKCSLSSSPV